MMSEMAEPVSERVRDPAGSIFLSKIGDYVMTRAVILHHSVTEMLTPNTPDRLKAKFLSLQGNPDKLLEKIIRTEPAIAEQTLYALEFGIWMGRGVSVEPIVTDEEVDQFNARRSPYSQAIENARQRRQIAPRPLGKTALPNIDNIEL